MSLHSSVFEYLPPTDDQHFAMAELRLAARAFAEAVERLVPDGPDKTIIIHMHRTTAMWADIAITRLTDGTPRSD
jgi:hypothetical protein